MLGITHISLKRMAKRSHSKFQSPFLAKDEKVMPTFAMQLTLELTYWLKIAFGSSNSSNHPKIERFFDPGYF